MSLSLGGYLGSHSTVSQCACAALAARTKTLKRLEPKLGRGRTVRPRDPRHPLRATQFIQIRHQVLLRDCLAAGRVFIGEQDAPADTHSPTADRRNSRIASGNPMQCLRAPNATRLAFAIAAANPPLPSDSRARTEFYPTPDAEPPQPPGIARRRETDARPAYLGAAPPIPCVARTGARMARGLHRPSFERSLTYPCRPWQIGQPDGRKPPPRNEFRGRSKSGFRHRCSPAAPRTVSRAVRARTPKAGGPGITAKAIVWREAVSTAQKASHSAKGYYTRARLAGDSPASPEQDWPRSGLPHERSVRAADSSDAKCCGRPAGAAA
jgi:hypothetical protein